MVTSLVVFFERVRLQVEVPPFSEKVDGVQASVTVGLAAAASVNVNVLR